MEVLFAIGFFAVFALAIASFFWSFRRSEAMMRKWAQQNNYRIVEAKIPMIGQGPFFWTTSRSQSVYRVVVQDSKGKTRSGWVRCGHWLFGMQREQTEVIWDEEN